MENNIQYYMFQSLYLKYTLLTQYICFVSIFYSKKYYLLYN